MQNFDGGTTAVGETQNGEIFDILIGENLTQMRKSMIKNLILPPL
jgi:hypothetical protein